MQILRISNPINTTKINTTKSVNPHQYTSFTGNPVKAESKLFAPIKKFFAPVIKSYKVVADKIESALAEFISKFILETKPAKWLVEKTKNSDKLPLHLGTLTGTTLSIFYMKKTLENKNLDPQKKKTLAINQGATTILSTILSYSLNGFLTKSIDKFTEKYMKINSHVDADLLSKYKTGIKTASQLMIFQTIFRFIAPVAVTPIANHIGNKLQEKKEAEIAGKKQND